MQWALGWCRFGRCHPFLLESQQLSGGASGVAIANRPCSLNHEASGDMRCIRNAVRLFLRTTLGVGLTLATASWTYSQAVQEVADTESSALHKKMSEFAAKITVHSPGKNESKPALVDAPIFRWTNPERKTDVGNIFLWTIDGRPHVTLGVWPEDNTLGYEMQSLSPTPFLVEFPNGEEWKQNTGALKFAELMTKKPPSKSEKLRSLEMRHIVRTRFRGRVQDWDKKNPGQLRLLPNPLYRYGKDKPKHVVDGAVFAFALGTDPEMFVLLEVRKHVKSGELKWFYAFGSATLYHLDGYLDGIQVWNDRQKLRSRTYFMRY